MAIQIRESSRYLYQEFREKETQNNFAQGRYSWRVIPGFYKNVNYPSAVMCSTVREWIILSFESCVIYMCIGLVCSYNRVPRTTMCKLYMSLITSMKYFFSIASVPLSRNSLINSKPTHHPTRQARTDSGCVLDVDVYIERSVWSQEHRFMYDVRCYVILRVRSIW